MGDHHFSLQVIADVPDGGVDGGGVGGGVRLKALNDAHRAGAQLSLPIPACWWRARTWRLEAAFWAQLPGNFPFRPRKAPITSRNFAAMAPFHNYPLGRAHGNHWGEALTHVRHQRPLALLLLAARQRSQATPRAVAARTRATRSSADPQGPGKPYSLAFSIAMLTRQGRHAGRFSTRIAGSRFWCAHWREIIFPLKNGIPTGFNPLQLPSYAGEHGIPQGAGCAS